MLCAARTLLLFILLPVLVACAESVRGPLAGASDAWATDSEPAREPASPGPALPAVPLDYAAMQQWPVVNGSPFKSLGHEPEQLVDVRVNPTAAASYAALVTDTVFPEGSILAELPHGSTGRGYVMEKSQGRWSYRELDARGSVLSSGPLALCEGCHAEAPGDRAFGLPRLR